MKNEPYLLAIDCSGRIGSVAVGRGPSLLAERVFSGKMRHSRELFVSMEAALEEVGCGLQDVGAFCFTVGPGSFTGLRIAVTTAKMLHFARKIPLISVNTLDTIAYNTTDYIAKGCQAPLYLSVVLDAKQNSFFSAVYRWDGLKWIKYTDDMVIPGEKLVRQLVELGRSAVVGEGLFYHRELFQTAGIQIIPDAYWSASARAVLKAAYPKYCSGQFDNAFPLVPYYIRPPEITEKAKK